VCAYALTLICARGQANTCSGVIVYACRFNCASGIIITCDCGCVEAFVVTFICACGCVDACSGVIIYACGCV
jgi:hypothetical protein